ncbi:MAG: phosphoribosyltransferase family protein [Fibrobacterales bacterium]
MDKLVVTGNTSDNPFAIDVAQLLGIPIDISDLVALRCYANSEFCPRFISDESDLENIGTQLVDRTVIICSTSSNTHGRNSLAMRNFILARSAKENGAKHVILVEPDLFFSAQDRGPYVYGDLEKDRTMKDLKKFDGQAFTSLLYAQLLKQSGVDSVITVHNHSVKVQTLFNEVFEGNFHNLIPAELYADYLKKSDLLHTGMNGENLILCAPDKGAVPFVKMVHEYLGLPDTKILLLNKERSGERKVSIEVHPESEVTIADLAGKDVIVMDDMVRTGNTIVESCAAIKKGNPNKVAFGVTHFYPSQEARENLNNKAIDEIMTTNTIHTVMNRDSQGRLRKKLVVLKIGKWICRHILQMLEMEENRFDKDFYSIDMSSKNPRWPPPSV